MSHPETTDNTAADLAESLTAEYNQATKSGTADAVSELQSFIDQVPQKTELTSGRGLKYGLAVGTLIMAGFTLMAISSYLASKKDLGLIGFCVVCTLLLALAAWANRNADKFVFMTLDHRNLRVHNLSAPIDLLQVAQVSYKDGGWIQTLMLELGPDAAQAPHRKQLSFSAAKAIYTRTRGVAKVRIMSAGYRVDGKRLTDEQVMGLLETYLNVARAEHELKQLRERQAGFI